MKILEVRRHSIRSKPGDHLNQAGVTLARFVGQNIGPFERVITSTLPRAFETAIAMGFAVHEQNELMSTTGSAVEREAPWPLTFPIYAEVIKQDGFAAKYAAKLAKYFAVMMEFISEGRSGLVVNHGGVLEMGVIACLPDHDFSGWGDYADYCEGARLYWENGRFFRGEVLRVSK